MEVDFSSPNPTISHTNDPLVYIIQFPGSQPVQLDFRLNNVYRVQYYNQTYMVRNNGQDISISPIETYFFKNTKKASENMLRMTQKIAYLESLMTQASQSCTDLFLIGKPGLSQNVVNQIVNDFNLEGFNYTSRDLKLVSSMGTLDSAEDTIASIVGILDKLSNYLDNPNYKEDVGFDYKGIESYLFETGKETGKLMFDTIVDPHIAWLEQLIQQCENAYIQI